MPIIPQSSKSGFLKSAILKSKMRMFGFLAGLVLLLGFSGCMSIPANLLVLPPDALALKEQQSRKYSSEDEKKMIQASAGVLQDLGFTIDKSETDLGFINSSKNRSAVSAGQTAFAIALDVAAAFGGAPSNNYGQTDKEQQIQASLIVLPALSDKSTIVRVKFQRIVWNRMGQVSRYETLREANLYQDFFEKLSKSVFLEEQKI